MLKFVTRILSLISRKRSKVPVTLAHRNPEFVSPYGSPKHIAVVFGGDVDRQVVEHTPRCKEEHGSCPYRECRDHGCQL